MNLFILGATGAIGKHLLDSALERGHQVTSYVRSPQKIHLTHERLKVVRGSVFDVDQMAHSLTGNDIILSAFGPTTVRSSTLRREFGRTLAAAMRKSGVRRAQIVSAAFLFPDIGFVGRILKATLFRRMIPDMAGMEAEVSQSDLDWTVVRPPRLTNDPITDAYRIMDGALPPGGFSISRADVAQFMIDEAEKPAHVQQVVGLAD